ncbi:hypothetical protein T08_5635 [Trichinella sp. T8]|nr:hypothetical protein T08_5635 [Trichinella sp. T8]
MLDLSWAFSCRYTANAPPVSRSGITLATSLMSRSLHTSSKHLLPSLEAVFLWFWTEWLSLLVA